MINNNIIMNDINRYSRLLIVLLGLVLATGCSKDFLNQTPLDQVPAEEVWKDPSLAKAFVTEIYNGLGQGGFEEQMLASLSDEAVFTHTGRNINTVNEGSLSATILGWVSETYAYGNMYQRIRACNLTVSHLGDPASAITDQEVKSSLLGQAYFLRAYYYQQLLRYYGGVPIITGDYGLKDSFDIARNTYSECVDFIIKDLDSAATLLQGKSMASGEATRLAALALKSRVLLYAASDLHVADNLAALPEFTQADTRFSIDLLAYSTGSQAERWKKAKAAALEALQEGNGYKLDLSAPVKPEEGKDNYISIAMGGASKAPGVDPAAAIDLIFARYFSPAKDELGEYIGKYNGPNGYHNWSGNTPLGLLVDDYQMIDGRDFNWSDKQMAAHPYLNRDPRFYATILYDGADWKPRNKVSADVDPVSQIQSGMYDLLDSKGNKITYGGLDTRSSSIEDWNGSRTGYYMRKFIDPDPNLIDANDKQFIPWPFIRYTEVVLNYVEACLETSDEGEAISWLNKVRFRVGMPAITASGKDLIEAYRNERRVELAYEEHRYHDARRWMIAEETQGRKLSFIRVTGKFKAGKSMKAPYRHDESVYDYTYTPITDNAHENRTWLNKMYFRPFSRDELNKNNLLVQNPGYGN